MQSLASSPRKRAIINAIVAIAAVWILAVTGYFIAQHSKMTADKLRAYLESTELSRLSGEARAKALRDLADRLNALSAEERRKARMGKLWGHWFDEMTEQEKSAFLDATLPTGFKQMLAGFESLPQEKRQKAIDAALKRLKEANAGAPANPAAGTGGAQAGLSPDLQKKVAAIGLKSVYSESSAQTKAELAPLMEELQRSMESGRLFRGN